MKDLRALGNTRRINDWKIFIGILVGIGTLAGMCVAMASYPIQWSRNGQRLDIIEPIVWKNKSDIGELKVIEQAHQDDIVRRLARIENKIDEQHS